jgi:hypothetical protein
MVAVVRRGRGQTLMKGGYAFLLHLRKDDHASNAETGALPVTPAGHLSAARFSLARNAFVSWGDSRVMVRRSGAFRSPSFTG